MTQQVRVRFAPSPTGFLHIGGARTALFNWLYARSQGGKFLLRIEDTDRERSEDRFTEDILESLRWLGMEADEEPVFQSKRLERHQEVVDELLEKKLAYRCDCSPEKLDAVRKQCQKDKLPYRYPGFCRDKSPEELGEKSVIRLRTPDDGETGFSDRIRGAIAFPNKDVDDWVICRTDGTPTYNFVVVVDDHDQGVTDILRGDDHINNTPKQLMLYTAMGWEPPRFAHLPMILGPDGSKLSKRHGAASTLEYRTMGYLPEAIVNFLVRLGWSHGDDEVFTSEQLQKVFNLEAIGKSGARFNPEKLTWYSGHFFRERSASSLLEYMKTYFKDTVAFDVEEKRLMRGIEVIQGKIKTIPELAEQLEVLFGPALGFNLEKVKEKDRRQFAEILPKAEQVLEASDFSEADLEKRIQGMAEELELKFGPIGKTLRFAVTGGRISPGLFEMLSVMGKERVLGGVRALRTALGS